MNNKKKNYCAPVLDWFRFSHTGSSRNGLPQPYSPETMKALDDLFAMIRQISPYYENGVRKLFFQVDRGSIEDYGNYDELLADGTVKNREEFEEMWKLEYPGTSRNSAWARHFSILQGNPIASQL